MIRVDSPASLAAHAEHAPALPARSLQRLSEFLLVGGLTPLLFPLAWLFRRSVGLDDSVYWVSFVMFYAAHVINDPHFAVTYVLFYKDVRARALGGAFTTRQRLRYLIAGFVVPLLLAGWAIAALSAKSSDSLALLVQLMFLLVGWHYVKQGFGILTVLGARRGVRFHAGERLAILAHCYAGWAYAWASPFDPGREVEEKGLIYRTIAHPLWLEPLTQITFLATIAPLVYVLVQKRRREGSLPLLTPLTGLLCSVWAWSIYSSIDPLVRYVVPALHSLQYLYMVWLLKSNEAREREREPWFETSAPVRLALLALTALGLGLLLFHIAPSALDGALVDARDRGSRLGPTPYFVALYAFVNIHHYFMDTVLWRRENPLTRYLRVDAAR